MIVKLKTSQSDKLYITITDLPLVDDHLDPVLADVRDLGGDGDDVAGCRGPHHLRHHPDPQQLLDGGRGRGPGH